MPGGIVSTLRETLPDPVSSATIHRHYLHCMQLMSTGLEQLRNLRRGWYIRLTGMLLASQSGGVLLRVGAVYVGMSERMPSKIFMIL